jgi:hypothetical protein
VRQMKDHVRPVLARRIPTICVLLSAFLQERVSYFTVYMLLLLVVLDVSVRGLFAAFR